VIHGLESAGFKLMSVDATFHMKPDPIHRNPYSVDNEIRIEEYCDKYDSAFSALIKNTAQFFAGTQYYNSPYFDRRLCDLFYRRWILKDIGGRSNRNYLAIYENRIVGFSLCIEKDNEAIIDLIWVDEDMRGRGVGTLMIYKLFNDVKNKVVKVPTQITNSNAINLYIKTGFKIKDIYAAYHKYGGNR
jgi:ribosomal protein S18 acetylase RimI-like enzyme